MSYRPRFRFSTAAAISALALFTPFASAEELPWLAEARERAVLEASERLDLPVEALEIAAEGIRTDREGEPVATFKIYGQDGVLATAVGVRAGGVVEELHVLDQHLRDAALEADKIGPELRLRMAENPQGLHRILVWLSSPPFEPLPPPELGNVSDEELDAFDAANAEALHAHLEPVFEAYRQRLAAVDLVEAGATDNAPLLWLEAQAGQIEEMAAWPETARIDADEEMEPFLDVAHKTVFANWVHATGNRGAYGRVAFVEVGAPYPVHPAILPAPPTYTVHVVPQRSGCEAPPYRDHALGVMGALWSRDSTHTGIAPQARLGVGAACGRSTSDMMDTTDKVINEGSWVVNFSWGFRSLLSFGPADRYFDYLVKNRYRTFVAATGNSGDTYELRRGLHLSSSPAHAYNTLGVGAFDDRGTTDRLDDRMATWSSFDAPPSTNNDRQKPELVAPGERITVPTTGLPFGEVSGTSVATPMVTGVAGLVLHAQRFLYFFPEALRAVLLASASHNLEGPEARGPRDGAGGVDAEAAVATAVARTGDWGNVRWSCSSPTTATVASVDLVEGG
ncbi:MAG: S8 family serine peptidase, partial [Acidobacteria bacterium]|nr:S8 family serine peptidase [Acidobacteriota bacterium]